MKRVLSEYAFVRALFASSSSWGESFRSEPPGRRSRAASCASPIATVPPACRSTRKARSRSVMPMMGVFNNLVVFDPQVRAEQPRRHRARSRHQVDVERGRQDADLRAARGREVARRQAVHRGRRQMHLRSAGRHGQGELQGQLPQGLVRQRRERHDQRRPRGGRSISRRRSPRCWRCSPRASRRSIPATSRRPRCAARRSAPGRSSSSSTSRTRASRWRATRTTGSRACPISTASSTRSSPTARRRSWPSSRASST